MRRSDLVATLALALGLNFYVISSSTADSPADSAAQVVGSLVVNCGQATLYTHPQNPTAASIFEPAVQWQTDWTTQCLIGYQELLSYCQRRYASRGPVMHVIPGSTMISIDQRLTQMSDTRETKTFITRPYWCMTGRSLSITLPTPSECRRLQSNAQGNVTHPNPKPDLCRTQQELEAIGQRECSLPVQNGSESMSGESVMQLVGAIPSGICSASFEVYNSLQFFSIQLLCCSLAGEAHVSRFKRLEPAQSLYRIVHTDVPSTVTQWPSASKQLMAQYERHFADLAAKTKSEFHQFWLKHLHRTLDRQYNKSAELQRALVEFATVWLEEEKQWAQIESMEHADLVIQLESEDQASLDELNYVLLESPIQVERVQSALARLLGSLAASVDEEVRHLTLIRLSQPWQLHILPFGGTAVSIERVHNTTLAYIRRAAWGINILHQVMADKSIASTPIQAYAPELVQNYQGLQRSLKQAEMELRQARRASLALTTSRRSMELMEIQHRLLTEGSLSESSLSTAARLAAADLLRAASVGSLPNVDQFVREYFNSELGPDESMWLNSTFHPMVLGDHSDPVHRNLVLKPYGPLLLFLGLIVLVVCPLLIWTLACRKGGNCWCTALRRLCRFSGSAVTQRQRSRYYATQNRDGLHGDGREQIHRQENDRSIHRWTTIACPQECVTPGAADGQVHFNHGLRGYTNPVYQVEEI